MKYLSASDVLFIHSALIDETGGTHGIRDLGLLESAIALPQQGFGGQDLHPTLMTKASALFYSLVKNHPFVDGNKRTSITALGVFLGLNSVSLKVDQNDMVEFVMAVAGGLMPQDKIAPWIEAHTSRL
jgi:death on curing protein